MNVILAPVGGAVNHIRWLCLLDQSFNIKKITQKDKFDFILNDVYSDDRTWHNWLLFEWVWRNEIDDVIYLHNSKIPKPQKNFNFNKILHINANGGNCYRHYVKFNSSLNNKKRDNFIRRINFSNIVYKNQSDKKLNQNFGHKCTFLSIDFDYFYKNNLDNKIIEEINSFFSIDIPFDQATEVHNKWISLNKKAELEIVDDLKKLYGNSK